jgi:LacI family transcriptional regulator
MTIRHVAELAGVSIATVSRVVNGHADVSSQTREAVQRVIREHGYPAGQRARAGRAGRAGQIRGGQTWAGQARTGQIGVMVPLIHPGCFAEILAGAVEALYEQDLQAVLGPTRHSRAREVSLLERLRDGAADGAIIVLPEESGQEFAALAARGFPVVIVDPRTEVAEGIPVVCAAHSSGATQATRHLLELGHRRIAVIGGPRGWVATEERMRGYHAALAGAGVLPDPALVRYSDFCLEGGREAAAHLLTRPDPPTAIFAFNDGMAAGALQAVSARGLRVPADVSVIGFDDTVEAAITAPALTTVRQPLAELGRTAVSLLLRQLEDRRLEPLRIELATRLVIRDSTASPPGRPGRASEGIDRDV